MLHKVQFDTEEFLNLDEIPSPERGFIRSRVHLFANDNDDEEEYTMLFLVILSGRKEFI
jgi:hypothetical protein